MITISTTTRIQSARFAVGRVVADASDAVARDALNAGELARQAWYRRIGFDEKRMQEKMLVRWAREELDGAERELRLAETYYRRAATLDAAVALATEQGAKAVPVSRELVDAMCGDIGFSTDELMAALTVDQWDLGVVIADRDQLAVRGEECNRRYHAHVDAHDKWVEGADFVRDVNRQGFRILAKTAWRFMVHRRHAVAQVRRRLPAIHSRARSRRRQARTAVKATADPDGPPRRRFPSTAIGGASW